MCTDKSNSELPMTPAPLPTPPPKVNKEQLRYIVLDCFDARQTREEIRRKVMAYGYSEVDADRFVESIEMEQRRTMEYDNEVRGDPKFFVRFGGGMCLFGIGLVIACVVAASYDSDLASNPLLIGVSAVGAAASFIGARLFWRGFS